MSEVKATRLSKIASEFNVGISTIVDFLKKKGHDIDANPNTKIAPELYALLSKEYSSDVSAKKDAERVNIRTFREKKETLELTDTESAPQVEEDDHEPEVLIKDTTSGKKTPLFSEPPREPEFKVVGKINLEEKAPKKPKDKPQPPVIDKAVNEDVEQQEKQVQPEPEKPVVEITIPEQEKPEKEPEKEPEEIIVKEEIPEPEIDTKC